MATDVLAVSRDQLSARRNEILSRATSNSRDRVKVESDVNATSYDVASTPATTAPDCCHCYIGMCLSCSLRNVYTKHLHEYGGKSKCRRSRLSRWQNYTDVVTTASSHLWLDVSYWQPWMKVQSCNFCIRSHQTHVVLLVIFIPPQSVVARNLLTAKLILLCSIIEFRNCHHS